MEHTKWFILFTYCFVFADSAPSPTQPSEERDITEVLKRTINKIMDPPTENVNMFSKQIRDGENIPRATVLGKARYLEIQPLVNGVTFQLHQTVSLVAFAKRYNQTSELVFPVKGMFSYTVQNTATDGRVAKSNDGAYKVEVSDVDHFDVLQIQNYIICGNLFKKCLTKETKLHPSNYFKPNEEEKTKHEIKNSMTNTIKEILEKEDYSTIKSRLLDTIGELLHNTKVQYYPVGTVSTSHYTLNNVTIKGLWNIHSLSTNTSDSGAVVQVDLGAVTGSMTQYFGLGKKEPLELSFNANNIYIYEDRNAAGRKLHSKITGFSVKNTKTNLLLEENESKSIMAHVESAFAASVVSK